MDSDTKLEIEWRRELLARLQAPLNVLQRKAAKEKETLLARARELSVYESAEEAHDAFGYGEITYDEYLVIKARFDNVEYGENEAMTAVQAALEELLDFMRRLRKQIGDLEWSTLSEEEKTRIQSSNEAYLAELQTRKGGLADVQES